MCFLLTTLALEAIQYAYWQVQQYDVVYSCQFNSTKLYYTIIWDDLIRIASKTTSEFDDINFSFADQFEIKVNAVEIQKIEQLYNWLRRMH